MLDHNSIYKSFVWSKVNFMLQKQWRIFQNFLIKTTVSLNFKNCCLYNIFLWFYINWVNTVKQKNSNLIILVILSFLYNFLLIILKEKIVETSIFCRNQYFLSKPVFFCRNQYFLSKPVFFVETSIFCRNQYFLSKQVFFVETSIFCRNQYYLKVS